VSGMEEIGQRLIYWDEDDSREVVPDKAEHIKSTGYWLRFFVPLNTKLSLETFPKPITCLGMKKQNLAQQKHTFTNQNKCTQNKHK